jgi:hypothetical protein
MALIALNPHEPTNNIGSSSHGKGEFKEFQRLDEIWEFLTM